MATRSTIAIQLENSTIKQVYCHWDGYLSNNGKILVNHYKDSAKVIELINQGSISILDKNINPSENSKHDFNNKETDVCVFYCRDREEQLDIEEFKDFEDYINNANFEEFNYIFKNNEWYYSEDNNNTFEKVIDNTFEKVIDNL
jgi:hypothetical protein